MRRKDFYTEEKLNRLGWHRISSGSEKMLEVYTNNGEYGEYRLELVYGKNGSLVLAQTFSADGKIIGGESFV